MPTDAKHRRTLSAKGHHLKATVSVSADELSDAVIAHLRRSFAGRELLKLRIHADGRDECDAVAAELARRVPCEVVRRIGRVLLLYRPTPGPETAQ